jgi:hypothetical protein
LAQNASGIKVVIQLLPAQPNVYPTAVNEQSMAPAGFVAV